MRRSMLFIPGNTPNLLMNGDVLGADSIILDLEDAVSPAEKDSARILVRNALKNLHYQGCEIIIRINPVETEYWTHDLDEIIPLKPNMIMPPKVSCAQDVKTVSEYIGKLEEKLGYVYMDVTTVLGRKTICIADVTSNVRLIRPGYVTIVDVQGNRYTIDNLDALDKDTRQKIELYI